jgi:hypothetical protein
MTLLLLRAGMLAQSSGSAPPPAPDLYVPPSPDSIALDFALDATGAPYAPPASDAVVLEFAVAAPPVPPAPGIYDPPASDSIVLAFTGGAYLPPPATAIPLEF